MGDTVQSTTAAAGGAAAPVSPGAADAVSAVGQAVDRTVTDVGHVVGGALGGLG
ncbi:MAG TPA: hypothetical protein VNT03_07295 [Baekduia sp.]|nr:hypothetical protein [Baekduia sp.]